MDELGQIAVDAGYYDVDTALDSIVIPVHPGAERYLNEARGLETGADEKPEKESE